MPFDDLPTAFDDTLMAQDAALKRRRAILAEQARQAAARQGIYAPYEPDNREVGGFTLSTGQHIPGRIVGGFGPALNALAPLVAQYRNDQQQADFDTQDADFQARVRKDALARIAAQPVARAADPGIQPLTPNDDEGNPMPIPKEATPAYEPSLRDRLTWAMSLQGNPETAKLGSDYVSDAVLKEPERIAAREERQHEKALARAEAKRKQEEDLRWRTWQQQQHNQTLATIAAMRHGGGGGGGGGSSATPGLTFTDDNGNPVEGWARKGVKASDIVKDVDPSGNVTLTDKLTGQRLRVGGGGAQSGTHQKDQQETRDAIERSQMLLSEAENIDKLLQSASASGLNAAVRRGVGWATGYSSPESRADRDLVPLADLALKSVPRFSGPTSDGDRKDYAAAAGQLANPDVAPEDRRSALRTVVRLHQKSIKQQQARSTFSGDTNARKSDNNSNLGKPPAGGGPRSLTFNPATGKLE